MESTTSYTFPVQTGALVVYFTSPGPGIDTRQIEGTNGFTRLLVYHPKDRDTQSLM